MMNYIEATDAYIDYYDNDQSEKDRLLIWLAAVNESLPDGKRLGDTEIQLLARAAFELLTKAIEARAIGK